MKILFILKSRTSEYNESLGLINSAKFVANALKEKYFDELEIKLATVHDDNGIDKEIHHFRPDFVIIEAIFVRAEKLLELCLKYKCTQFAVRMHSKAPFLSLENHSFRNLNEYEEVAKVVSNLDLSFNNANTNRDISQVNNFPYVYLPNIYTPPLYEHRHHEKNKDVIKVGIFGAIRPLKNNLNCVLAAIKFAQDLDKKLEVHINGSRLEGAGAGVVLKNIKALFHNKEDRILVEHPWLTHEEFIHVVRQMDLGISASFSESFCLIISDFINNDVPIVGSTDIDWISYSSQADPSDTRDIVHKCFEATRTHKLSKANKKLLKEYNEIALQIWIDYLEC